MTVTVPGGISSDTLSNALWRPKYLLTPVIEIWPSGEWDMDGLLLWTLTTAFFCTTHPDCVDR